MREKASRQALVVATGWGVGLQLIMVLVGHWVTWVAALFGILGLTISLGAGFLYGLWAPSGPGRGALSAVGGGSVAGGVCALLGILVSWLLGDVAVLILAVGTLSSAVTGALGGLGGWAISRSAPA